MKLGKILICTVACMTVVTLAGCFNIYKEKNIGSSTENNEKQNNIETESLKFSSDESKEVIENLSCNISLGNIEFKQGDKFAVEADNVKKGYCKINVENETLKIKYDYRKNGELLRWGKENIEKFTIVIPKNTELNNISIKAGTGDIVGAADLLKSQILSIDNGCGDIKLPNINSKDMTINVGTGDVDAGGIFDNEVNINNGTGNVTIQVKENNIEQYNMDLSTGVGEINVNDKSHGNEYTNFNENSSKKINVDMGVGDINIKG